MIKKSVSRRGALRAVGLAGSAGVLAACGETITVTKEVPVEVIKEVQVAGETVVKEVKVEVAGETVVVEGFQRVRSGMKVNPKPQEASKAAKPAAGTSKTAKPAAASPGDPSSN